MAKAAMGFVFISPPTCLSLGTLVGIHASRRTLHGLTTGKDHQGIPAISLLKLSSSPLIAMPLEHIPNAAL
ncbi:hypothetical protein F4805DRAFT_412591 [Annulohypoxylon moriforme]|nr:hypothetical protein F4805DRAFT_412591 [Annulohypoxylon moriforme]